MSMTHDEASRLMEQIARDHPQVRCELQEYAGVWQVIVRNPRTNEEFGIVSPRHWEDRLLNMEGVQPPRAGQSGGSDHPAHQ
jgi:hypothetical protein